MVSPRQDPIAAIEQAVFALRHTRPHGRRPGGPHDAPPWMRSGLVHDATGMRGRGPGDRMLGGAARLRLLSALAERDGLSVSDIAESIGVDQPRASRLVNDSAERGLVTRTSDGRDARRSVVQLTDAGRAMLQTATDSRRTAVTEALAGFSAEETATFADLLTRFTAVWQHHRH